MPSIRKSSESGAILILMAFLVVAIFSVVALVIDLNLAAASIEQARQYTRLAALGAIEEYFDFRRKNPNNLSSAAGSALTRAQSVSALNVMLGNQTDIADISASGAANSALLTFGTWRQDAANCSGATCWCPSGKNPCFLEWGNGDRNPPSNIPANAAPALPNAVKIAGNFYGEGVLTHFAKNFFGIASIPVRTSAVASIIPRHGCFLIDNSGSMVSNTHGMTAVPVVPPATPVVQGSDFGILLTPSGPPVTAHDFLWQWLTVNRPTRGTNLTVPVTLGTLQPPAMSHFIDDYRNMFIMGDGAYTALLSSNERALHPDPSSNSTYSTGQGNTSFPVRIDTFEAPTENPAYNGPEPLRTVFQGLNFAMTTFSQRSVAGDMACLIFYDQGLSWPRIVNLTSNFQYLRGLTDFRKTDINGNPVTIVDEAAPLSDSTLLNRSGFDRIVRHGLFPSGNANTNTAAAINEAITQLARSRNSSGVPSSDFLVFIGDGLTNCIPQAGTIPADCSNDFAHYQSATSFVDALVPGIRDAQIPMHFISVGNYVEPHSVVIPKLDESCYTDAELRSSNQNQFRFVDDTNQGQSGFDGMSSTNPFTYANFKQYQWAVFTKGIWGPIRPSPVSCQPEPVTAACSAANIQAAQDRGDIVQRNGRPHRVTDPQCRSTQQQIQNYMSQVIGSNPYTIVQVEEH